MTRIFQTKDGLGNPTGRLMLLWNALEQPEMRPDQIYVCTIAPQSFKGPHLHYKRRGWFHCIKGSAHIRILREGQYVDVWLIPGTPPVEVHPGEPCCLYNVAGNEAFLVNMPSPAYDPNDPDEHVPDSWQHPEWWQELGAKC